MKKIFTTFLSALLVFGCVGIAFADLGTERVFTPYQPPSVEVSSQTELTSALTNDSDITITDDFDVTAFTVPAAYEGKIDLNDHTITANGKITVASGANLTLENGTILRGEAFTNGAVIDIKGTLNIDEGAVIDGNRDNVTTTSCLVNISSGGKVNLIDGSIQNNLNHSQNSASGVLVSGGTLNMYDDGEVTNCEAKVSSNKGGNGGGVAVTSKGTFNMCGGTVSNCTATGTIFGSGGAGGGVYLNGGTFIMTDGTITGNKAYSGAGICSSSSADSIAIIKGGLISSNIASSGGGGAQNNSYLSNDIEIDGETYSSAMIILGGTFSSNAAIYGGGVHHDDAKSGSTSIWIEDAKFIDNKATSGGGICIEHSKTSSKSTVKNVTITSTEPSTNGAGVYIKKGSVDIIGSIIKDNTVKSDGGGVYITGGTTAAPCVVNIIDSDISGNTAERNGGGVYTGKNTIFTITDCDINKNIAKSGGGLYIDGANSTIIGCNVTENTASSDGGGLYSASSTIQLGENSIITKNTAAKAGGGIYLAESSTAGSTFTMLSGSKLYSNFANTDLDDTTTASADDICSLSASGRNKMTLISVSEMDLPSGAKADYWYTDTVDDRYRRTETTPYDVVANDSSEQHLTLGVNAIVIYKDGFNGAAFSDVVYSYIRKWSDTPSFDPNDDSAMPTYDSYRFIGWSPEVSEMVELDTVTYVAQWEYAPTGITYSANHSDSSKTILDEGTVHSIRGKDTFTRHGYALRSWNTSPDGSGITYSFGETLTIDEPLTLYAMWQQTTAQVNPPATSETTSETTFGTPPTTTGGLDLEAGKPQTEQEITSNEVITSSTPAVSNAETGNSPIILTVIPCAICALAIINRKRR